MDIKYCEKGQPSNRFKNKIEQIDFGGVKASEKSKYCIEGRDAQGYRYPQNTEKAKR